MGPNSSILLDKKLEFEEVYKADEFLKSNVLREIKTTKSTRDFWVDSKKLPKLCSIGSDCQFSIRFDNALKWLEEDEILEIEKLTGKKIKSEIIISTGCNQAGDHNVLAELTLEIAKILNGLINFGGNLNIYKKGIEQELDGKVYSIKYNNEMAEYQISDIEFLTNWIKHPYFRMIK